MGWDLWDGLRAIVTPQKQILRGSLLPLQPHQCNPLREGRGFALFVFFFFFNVDHFSNSAH